MAARDMVRWPATRSIEVYVRRFESLRTRDRKKTTAAPGNDGRATIATPWSGMGWGGRADARGSRDRNETTAAAPQSRRHGQGWDGEDARRTRGGRARMPGRVPDEGLRGKNKHIWGNTKGGWGEGSEGVGRGRTLTSDHEPHVSRGAKSRGQWPRESARNSTVASAASSVSISAKSGVALQHASCNGARPRSSNAPALAPEEGEAKPAAAERRRGRKEGGASGGNASTRQNAARRPNRPACRSSWRSGDVSRPFVSPPFTPEPRSRCSSNAPRLMSTFAARERASSVPSPRHALCKSVTPNYESERNQRAPNEQAA